MKTSEQLMSILLLFYEKSGMSIEDITPVYQYDPYEDSRRIKGKQLLKTYRHNIKNSNQINQMKLKEKNYGRIVTRQQTKRFY